MISCKDCIYRNRCGYAREDNWCEDFKLDYSRIESNKGEKDEI